MGAERYPIVHLLALAAAGLLLWGCGADDPREGAPPDGSLSRASPSPPETASLDYALLASEPTRPESNRANHASLATSAEEASEQWRHFRLPGTPPDLDFGVDALLFLSGAESTGCPLEVVGLAVDHDAPSVVALVEPHADDCPSDDLPRTLVYRVRAADLPDTPFQAGIESHRLLPVS